MFLWKGALKICSKFTEHPCRSAISIKLQSNSIEITLWHGYSSVHLLHIFSTPFLKKNSDGLLLYLENNLRKRLSVTLNDIFDRIKILLLVLSSDFRVCSQISKRKPENFEKNHKNRTWERASCDFKKMNMSAKMCCLACLIIEPNSVM